MAHELVPPPLSVQPSSVFYYVKLIAFILYGMRLSFNHLIFVLSMLVIISLVPIKSGMVVYTEKYSG
jgi:hypothetical protein